jgi:hypothetical protein
MTFEIGSEEFYFFCQSSLKTSSRVQDQDEERCLTGRIHSVF